MPLSKDYSIMLYNKLIYTGVSRAKKSLTIIGDPSSFIRAVSNNYSKERRTSLKEFLQSNYDLWKFFLFNKKSISFLFTYTFLNII